jgi:tRNA (mo5U34)-methyltransferase
MCFGVYYHLLDPLYAFAQIRHCCHSDSIVLLEGVGIHLKPGEVLYSLGEPRTQAFLPSLRALEGFLKTAYLRMRSQARLKPPLRAIASRLKGIIGRRVSLDRVFLVCVPFEGVNELHYYEPPFGLKVYDDRFRG